MMQRNMRYEPMQRNGFCRGCDRELEIGEMAIKMYSIRRGQYIIFCPKCVIDMVALLKEDK